MIIPIKRLHELQEICKELNIEFAKDEIDIIGQAVLRISLAKMLESEEHDTFN